MPLKRVIIKFDGKSVSNRYIDVPARSMPVIVPSKPSGSTGPGKPAMGKPTVPAKKTQKPVSGKAVATKTKKATSVSAKWKQGHPKLARLLKKGGY